MKARSRSPRQAGRLRPDPERSTAIKLGAATDLGRKRETNEDGYIAFLPPKAPHGADALIAVADGMGGHQAGEVASALALQALDRLAREPAKQLDGAISAVDWAAMLRSAVQGADQDIRAQAQEDRRGMGTTLTAALISNTTLFLVHVGDSRAYLLRGGALRRLTEDHSWVAEEVRAGRMTESEAANHPRRNLLTNALGANEAAKIDSLRFDLAPGDRVLLCSDGLYGVASEDEIFATIEAAQGPKDACTRLIEAANRLGGPDNITAVLAELPGEPGAAQDRTGVTVIRDETVLPGGRRRRRRRRSGNQVMRLPLTTVRAVVHRAVSLVRRLF